MDKQTFNVDIDTINALIAAIGAVVFATVRQLSPEQQEQFGRDLQFLAKARGATEDTTAQDLLNHLAQMALSAPRKKV